MGTSGREEAARHLITEKPRRSFGSGGAAPDPPCSSNPLVDREFSEAGRRRAREIICGFPATAANSETEDLS